MPPEEDQPQPEASQNSPSDSSSSQQQEEDESPDQAEQDCANGEPGVRFKLQLALRCPRRYWCRVT
jgi:hypothetical protein